MMKIYTVCTQILRTGDRAMQAFFGKINARTGKIIAFFAKV